MRTIHAEYFLIKLLSQDLQTERVDVNTKYSGITREEYDNSIKYDEAIVDIKDLLKDAIVVGHDIMTSVLWILQLQNSSQCTVSVTQQRMST